MRASGGSSSGAGGPGVIATGGSGPATTGTGVIAQGGNSATGTGGDGIQAFPGRGHAAGFDGAAGTFFGDVVVTKNLGVQGDVSVTGNLTAFGIKQFKIDHPLNPEGKYLLHAAIESSEVLNVYSGNVTTNEQGEATVTLPAWFEDAFFDFLASQAIPHQGGTSFGPGTPFLHVVPAQYFYDFCNAPRALETTGCDFDPSAPRTNRRSGRHRHRCANRDAERDDNLHRQHN